MNTENLVRKAVTQLKLRWGLPSKGFIAGGSIANLVWSYLSQNPPKINDIDVFITDDKDSDTKIFEYEKKEIKYSESYSHLRHEVFIKEHYKIHSVSREGIFNFINISKDANPLMILKSFDINCTCVGYSIEEDKVYFLEDFQKFLETGELKIVNLMTPAHTAIRIVKKKDDLNAKLEDLELRIVQFCIQNKWFPDFDRFRFQQKYADLFTKYSDTLSKFFTMSDCNDIEKWLLSKVDKKVKIYELSCSLDTDTEGFLSQVLEKIKHRKYSITTNDLLFFFRNILENESLIPTWKNLLPFFKTIKYLDTEDKQKIEFIIEFIASYPKCIENLKGYTLSEQYRIIHLIIDKVTKKFSFETAIAVLGNKKVDLTSNLDDFDILLLGLSVRKKIPQIFV